MPVAAVRAAVHAQRMAVAAVMTQDSESLRGLLHRAKHDAPSADTSTPASGESGRPHRASRPSLFSRSSPAFRLWDQFIDSHRLAFKAAMGPSYGDGGVIASSSSAVRCRNDGVPAESSAACVVCALRCFAAADRMTAKSLSYGFGA